MYHICKNPFQLCGEVEQMLIETRMKNVFHILRRSYCSVSFVVSGQSKGLLGVYQIIQISWGGGGQGRTLVLLVQIFKIFIEVSGRIVKIIGLCRHLGDTK